MRILVHSWRDLQHPEAGGAEHYIVRVCEGLAARGHEVTIRTASYAGSVPEDRHNDVRYIRRGGRLTIYPIALGRQAVRRRDADVVIDIQNGMPYLSPLVSRLPTVNLVHHVHREQWAYLFGPRMSRLGWFLESSVATRVYDGHTYVAVSGSTKSELVRLGVRQDRIHVIPNGTDPWTGPVTSRSPGPRLVTLGRLVPQKRFEFAIDALAALVPDLPSVVLDVAGSGWWEDQLRHYAAEAGVVDRVVFHGHVSEAEKHALLAQAWVHLMPSVKEGWGLVVAEAGLHGTPTVAFRHAGGPSDSVRDGRTGLLVDEDSSEAFTRATRTLALGSEMRARMDLEVRDWVRQFEWEQSVTMWERLLHQVVHAAN
jgi:glycosyltransferase involved in cell wall biosynthesis